LAGFAVFAWFGLELLIGFSTGVEPMEKSATLLGTKIEQLSTEARVIIPGAQALFGFQFIAMLTAGFVRLPETAKLVQYVVVQKAFESQSWAVIGGAGSFLALIILWYAVPLALRSRSARHAPQIRKKSAAA
jgi:hypothetical protein